MAMAAVPAPHSERVRIDYAELVDGQLVRRRLERFQDSLLIFAALNIGSLAWVNGKRLKPGERLWRNGDELLHIEPSLDSPYRIPDDVAEEYRRTHT